MNKSMEQLVSLPDFDWDKAKYFYYVVRFGGQSIAAKRLHMSQPNLSRHISALEHRLKCNLFMRYRGENKRLHLTQKGEELYNIIDVCYAHLSTFSYEDLLKDARGKRIIRLLATHEIAAYILNPLILEYNASQSRTNVELIIGDTDEDFQYHNIDVTVLPYRLFSKQSVAQDTLFTLEKKLYASTDYLHRKGTPQEVADLVHHDFLGTLQDAVHHSTNLAWVQGLLPSPSSLKIAYSSNSLECLAGAARKGLGIISTYAPLSLLQNSDLQPVLPELSGPATEWYCTYPNHLTKDKNFLQFIQFLQENISIIHKTSLVNANLQATPQEDKVDSLKNFKANETSASQPNPKPDDASEEQVITQMMEAWNAALDEQLSLKPSPERQQKLLQLFQADFNRDLNAWQAFCEQVASTPFLRGAGARGWKATLDWCLDQDHARRVLEGHYAVWHKLSEEPAKSGQSSMSMKALTDQLQADLASEPDPYTRTFKQNLLDGAGPYSYQSWFRDLRLVRMEEQKLILAAPDALTRNMCAQRFHVDLLKAAERSFKNVRVVEIEKEAHKTFLTGAGGEEQQPLNHLHP